MLLRRRRVCGSTSGERHVGSAMEIAERAADETKANDVV
jgi:hypothetical protein